jgi:hypothetical protein
VLNHVSYIAKHSPYQKKEGKRKKNKKEISNCFCVTAAPPEIVPDTPSPSQKTVCLKTERKSG